MTYDPKATASILISKAAIDPEWRARTEMAAERGDRDALYTAALWNPRHAATCQKIAIAKHEAETQRSREAVSAAAYDSAQHRLDDYVAKKAAAKGQGILAAHGELAETDEVYRHLLKQVREAQDLVLPGAIAARGREQYAAATKRAADADTRAEADRMAKRLAMKPAERELNERAEAYAAKSACSVQHAMGALMETDASFRELYKRAERERFGA